MEAASAAAGGQRSSEKGLPHHDSGRRPGCDAPHRICAVFQGANRSFNVRVFFAGTR
jgi:hypothetical protein